MEKEKTKSTKHQTVYKRVRKWAVIQSTVDLLAQSSNIKKERKVHIYNLTKS